MVLVNFNENLEKYARLIAEVGVNVQESHTVVLQISVEQAPLARLITKNAYELGAAEVIVQWTDDIIQKEFLTYADQERITTIPKHKIDQTEDWIDKGASRISVVSSDPGSLAGVDPERVAAYQLAAGKAMHKLRLATQSNKVSWTVVAAAGNEWAKKSFLIYLRKKRKMLCGIKFSKPHESIRKIQLLRGKNTMRHYKKKPMS